MNGPIYFDPVYRPFQSLTSKRLIYLFYLVFVFSDIPAPVVFDIRPPWYHHKPIHGPCHSLASGTGILPIQTYKYSKRTRYCCFTESFPSALILCSFVCPTPRSYTYPANIPLVSQGLISYDLQTQTVYHPTHPYRQNKPNMKTTALAAAALLGTATAHMEMRFPAPLNSKYNPHTDPARTDYSMTSPLARDGSDYPCKGHHALLGTPAGAPTASLALGSAARVDVAGGAPHGGGSCQVSLSTDGARTFSVLKSVVGGCPAGATTSIGFTVPPDAPAGDAVLAWSWHNRIGNREMYMNCASVTLTGGGVGGGASPPPSSYSSYSSLPGIFVANVGNGCSVAEGGDVVYPDPGPDVVEQSTNPIHPDGDCGPSAPPPSGHEPAAGHNGGRASGGEGREGRHGPAGSRRPGAPVADTAAAAAAAAPPQRSTPAAEKPKGPPRPEAGGAAAPMVLPGTACAGEGEWRCLPAGDAFQRCASGQWSVVMPVAAGTNCVPGVTDDLEIIAAR